MYEQLTFSFVRHHTDTLALVLNDLAQREDVPLRIIDVQADHGAVRDHFALILAQPHPRSRCVLTYPR